MMWMMMLHWFQETGHKPIFLSGGGTAMIGDPTFKDKTRPLLTREDIESNIQSIKRGFSRYAKFGDGPTDAILVNKIAGMQTLQKLQLSTVRALNAKPDFSRTTLPMRPIMPN